MGTSIVLAIFVTAVATYISRFLGVLSSEKIKETSKIFRWFNCLAYSTLAALIARMIVFSPFIQDSLIASCKPASFLFLNFILCLKTSNLSNLS